MTRGRGRQNLIKSIKKGCIKIYLFGMTNGVVSLFSGWLGRKRKEKVEGKVFVFQVFRKYKLYLRFDLRKCDMPRNV